MSRPRHRGAYCLSIWPCGQSEEALHPRNRGVGQPLWPGASPRKCGVSPTIAREEGLRLWYSMTRERSNISPVNRAIVWKEGTRAHYWGGN